MAAWLVVACADHVARGLREGFIQACHGSVAPLRRMAAGDWVVCYSPSQAFMEGPPLRAFTALGRVRAGEAYRHDMGGGFLPWREDVEWLPASKAALAPLKDRLRLCADPAWGYRLRRGHLPLDSTDLARIAGAMGVDLPGVSEGISPAPAPILD